MKGVPILTNAHSLNKHRALASYRRLSLRGQHQSKNQVTFKCYIRSIISMSSCAHQLVLSTPMHNKHEQPK